MKRWMLVVAVLGIFTGCQNAKHEMSREQSLKRWYTARADVLCGLGGEQLKAGQLDAAAKSAKEAMALDGTCVGARVLLGKVHIEKGQYVQAQQQLRAAKAAEPTSSDICYLLAIAQENNGQLDDALASYREALVLDGNCVDAILAIGEVLAQMGKLDDALAYVEANMKVAGDNPGIYELAGRLATMMRDYDKAQRYCRLACDLDYGNPYYVEALARSQMLGKNYNEAVRTLHKLTANVDYGRRAWVYVMLGDCLLATGRPAEAREQYLRAGEIEPDSPLPWTGLAKASLAMSDTHRASLAAREALKADGVNDEASMVLGYTLVRAGQPDLAVGVLSRAASAHPNDAMLRCLLGQAHAAAGDADRARQCYDAALELEPDNKLARALLGDDGPAGATPAR